jgi:beta-phosphoglucomutase-like phosphatase (HAD superfamily)
VTEHDPEIPKPVTLDEVSIQWRVVLDAAQDALRAVVEAGSSVPIDRRELRERTARLAAEREALARLIDAVAREEHVPVHHRLSAPPVSKAMLGLPANALACIFDLDGVLTHSAELHAAAWAETFDEFLVRRAEHTHERFAPFTPFERREYDEHLAGRPRLDGVHAFLASRGIRVPRGRPDDPPGAETAYGLGNRKAELLRHRLEREGIAAFAGSQRYLEAARDAGVRCSVVSASGNTHTMLERAGLAPWIDVQVDGEAMRAERLRAKPAADTILAACRRLVVPPERAVTFETSAAGVAAGRAAGVGRVIAVDRRDGASELLAQGADAVVADLSELLDPALAS